MLKISYDTQDAIPENMRGAYVQKDGKWVLDDLEATHPVLVHNRTLKSEKDTAQSEAAAARTELANANVTPRGHVAVPKADADLLEKVKPLGTPEEITAKLTEHATLKSKVEAAERDKHDEAVATALGYVSAAFKLLPDKPEFELRDGAEKDEQGNPKKIVIAKIKGADGVITEKSGKEFIESSETYKPLLPALTVQKQEQGTRIFGSTPSTTTTTGDDPVTKRLQARAAQQVANPNPLMPKTAAAQP